MNEDQVKKRIHPGDFKMLLRLWPMLRSARSMLLLGVALILVSSSLGLLLPYVTKTAIDLYIIPVGQEFRPTGDMPPAAQKLLRSGRFYESGEPGLLFLKPDAAELLNKREEEELIAAGLLSRERWYVHLKDGEMSRLADEYPDQMRSFPNVIAIAEKDLSAFPRGVLAAARNADLDGLARLALIFAGLMLAGYIFDLGQRVIVEIGAQRMGHNLRQKVLEHLFGLSQKFFDHQMAGRLTSRVTNDVSNLNQLIKSSISTIFSDVVSMVGITVIMFWLSPKLAVITLIFLPVTAILSSYFGGLSRSMQRELRSKLAVINQFFAESIGGIAVIQAFRREFHNIKLFGGLNNENYNLGIGQLKIHAVFMPLIDLFASVVLALLIWYGGGAVMDDAISLGVVAAFLGYARRFFLPIQDVAEKVNIFQSAFASLERILDLLDEDDKIREAETPLTPIKPGGRVEFRNVGFRYDPEGPLVLDDVSFDIAPGESVALVGGTGSGKSTIISLMLRFYDPESGGIFFDGLPLRMLDLKTHSARLGLVTQDVYLYSATVMENLRLGRLEISDEAIEDAARAVGADRFIEKLPQGYDEHLGPGGRSLSAGERQLLSCARALVGAPEIVILDEATASVDSESELLIERALATLFTGRTSIIIAHRLSTIRRVDRIMVLNQGRIVESGSHEDLVAERGIYFRLAVLQGLTTL